MGYPLIKQCMNQGYEVVQAIAGDVVEPADEPLLREMFATLPNRPSVDQALDEIKAAVPLFQGLTRLQLREFLLDSDLRVLKAGDVVFRVGDRGNTVFCIVSGQVEIQLPGSQGALVRGPGEFFGEVALIAGRPRTATVLARTDGVLVELARRPALKLQASSEQARRAIERTSLLRQLQTYLSADLAEDDLGEVLDTAKLVEFDQGKTLIEQGPNEDRSVYVIRSGSVTVERRIDVTVDQRIERRNIVLAYVPAGHLVGEMALLRDGERMATVKAAVQTHTIRLDGAAFGRLLERRPELARTVDEMDPEAPGGEHPA